MIFSWIQLLRAPSSLVSSVSRDGPLTTFLGNLFQGFTTLMVQNFFPICSLNAPSLSLEPLLLVLPHEASVWGAGREAIVGIFSTVAGRG